MPPAPPATDSKSAPKTLMIAWHGRQGRQGMDKGILSTHVEPEIHIISDVGLKLAAEGKLKASAGRVFKLYPGINDAVSAEDWEKVSAYAGIRAQIAAGNISVLKGVEDSIAHIDESIAISEYAIYTIDKTLLERWNRNEKREKVKSAIEAHLAKLNERPAKPQQ